MMAGSKNSKSHSQDERRQHPRLPGNIPVKIRCDEFDLVTETKNLSRNGAYCKVNKFIEPMTKLKMQLLLPFKIDDKILTKKVACNGVVVRSESISGNNGFNVAIYFNEIKGRDAECISEFVNTTLEKKNTEIK